jgi:hypothetical protein
MIFLKDNTEDYLLKLILAVFYSCEIILDLVLLFAEHIYQAYFIKNFMYVRKDQIDINLIIFLII